MRLETPTLLAAVRALRRPRAVLVIKPETVVAGHRAGFRPFWRKRGRPPISADVVALIRRTASEHSG